MRRSKAPSELKKAKSHRGSNYSGEGRWSDPEDDQYTWGSRNNKLEQNKKVFNVVWRDISTRKHKTWKGDGILEVSNVILKATLRDETGKYLGSSTKFNRNELLSGFQMALGGKEIEIQDEVVGEDQLNDLRKRQIESRNWAHQDWISTKDMNEEEKKRKGGFIFRPILVLNQPKIAAEVKQNFDKKPCFNSIWIPKEKQTPTPDSKKKSDPCLSNVSPKAETSYNGMTCSEYICFLKPSELQQFLFQKVLEYSTSFKSGITLYKDLSKDTEQALKLICNHPSLINYKSTTSELIRNIIPALPDLTEMSPFDCAKLEFVQYFLTDLPRSTRQTCTIFAKTSIVLNMLQGLCDFMNIKCFQLVSNLLEGTDREDVELFLSENVSSKVLILQSAEVLDSVNIFKYCKNFIFFEGVSENLNMWLHESARDVIIYNLITAFSIEELLLLDTYNNDTDNLLDELVNVSSTHNDCCYLHSKIGCDCFKTSTDKAIKPKNIFIKNWNHFKNPFDVQLLKISALENLSENIVSIFVKNNS